MQYESLPLKGKPFWGDSMNLTYEHCTLCPRRCGVDRTAGQRGFCGMPAGMRVARAAPHLWEEPVISGQNGAGNVFFSGCTLQCVYCQNEDISRFGKGKPVDSARLRELFEQLIQQGCHTIGLVTPTHFLPEILPALTPKLPVPVVYNCGGYESVETLKALEGLVDVYLPDMKYSDNALAKKYSAAADYVEVADAAIGEMVRQTGPAVVENGILTRGVLVRHLQLPGHLDNTLGVLDWFAEKFPENHVWFSLMSQYVPYGRAKEMPELSGRVTELEWDAAVGWMEFLGIEHGFVQELSSASEAFIPHWEG